MLKCTLLVRSSAQSFSFRTPYIYSVALTESSSVLSGKLYSREDQISQLLTHIALKHRNMHCGASDLDVDAILKQFDNLHMCEYPTQDSPPASPKWKRDVGNRKQLRPLRTVLLPGKSNISAADFSPHQRRTNLHNTSQAMPRISSDENYHFGRNHKASTNTIKRRPGLRISRANLHKSRTAKRRVDRGSSATRRSACKELDRYDAVQAARNLSSSMRGDADPVLCNELRKNTSECYKKYLFAKEHDPLHDIAHGLHFGSIAILVFLFVEVRQYTGNISLLRVTNVMNLSQNKQQRSDTHCYIFRKRLKARRALLTVTYCE